MRRYEVKKGDVGPDLRQILIQKDQAVFSGENIDFVQPAAYLGSVKVASPKRNRLRKLAKALKKRLMH